MTVNTFSAVDTIIQIIIIIKKNLSGETKAPISGKGVSYLNTVKPPEYIVQADTYIKETFGTGVLLFLQSALATTIHADE